MTDWTRIPAPITSETDRRQLVSILASEGLEVRIAKVRETTKTTFKRYVEYRKED